MPPQIPPTFPAYPSAALIALMVLVAALFGLLYNLIFNKILKYSSVAVVVGVLGTGLILWGFFGNYTLQVIQALVLMALAFLGSGIPMIIGELTRKGKASHHRRPIPNFCRAIFLAIDNSISQVLQDIERTCAEKITAADLVRWINLLHEVKGMTKGVK